MSLHELVQKKLKLEHQWAEQAMSQKRVTPDMKWMDIDIKKLKVAINDQSVTDAKKELKVD
jgi:hypothetical protein